LYNLIAEAKKLNITKEEIISMIRNTEEGDDLE
jgi:DNA-binding transcriptional regulator YhcF (GntR family)